MKKDAFLLRIDNPCGQDWAAMERTDGARFCESCAKNVVDFTGLTTNQIAAVLEKSDGKICARLAPHQLDRVLRPLPESSARGRLVRAATGALLLLTAEEATAQIKSATHRTPVANDWQEIKVIDTPRLGLPAYDSSKAVLTGRVMDAKTKQPMGGVSVTILRTTVSASTDTNGFFSLIIPQAQWQKNLAFTASWIGRRPITFSVRAEDFPLTREVFFQESVTVRVMTGGLTIVKSSRRKWWQRSKGNSD